MLGHDVAERREVLDDRGTPMRALTGIDSMFVSLESNTNLFQVGAVAVLDPSTAPPGAPDPHEALRRVVESRLDRLPPFHRKLVEFPAGMDHPRWADVAPELAHHLRRGALPAPGADRELAAFAAQVLARPLDRRRPLWEINVVEGLEGGLVAGVAKIHHSAVDGLGGTEVTGNLMDLEPECPPAPQRPEIGIDAIPGIVTMLRDAAVGTGRRAMAAGRMTWRLTQTAARLRAHNHQLDSPPPPAMFSGPRTSLAGRLGPERVVGMAQVSRSDVDAIRRAKDVSVNDVVLALSASVVRRHLMERSELPRQSLVGFVPVSVREESDSFDSGVNRLSGMLVRMATEVEDPVGRLATIAQGTRSAKAQHQLLGGDFFSELAGIVPPLVLRPTGKAVAALGLTSRFPPFNVVVSSFPGPNFPLFCGGAEMLAYHPFGPIIDGAALNVTAMSYRDQIGFGLLACRDAVSEEEMELMARGISDAMLELTKSV